MPFQRSSVSIFGHSEIKQEYLIPLFVTAGMPQNLDLSKSITVLVYHGFVVGYSEDLKNPVWVAYRLGKTNNPLDSPRDPQFHADSRTTSQVSDKDYKGSGYDRGHMAPNRAIENHYGKLAQLETFFTTNVSPQTSKLNRVMWRKLETKEIK